MDGSTALISSSTISVNSGSGVSSALKMPCSLVYNSTTQKWEPSASLGPHVLGYHTDVTIAGLVTSDILMYDGIEWVNSQILSPVLLASGWAVSGS